MRLRKDSERTVGCLLQIMGKQPASFGVLIVDEKEIGVVWEVEAVPGRWSPCGSTGKRGWLNFCGSTNRKHQLLQTVYVPSPRRSCSR